MGLDEGIVALSPVYAAPETFVKVDENPTSFDVFSAALIMCQLLFNLLDERTDAGFCQQLKDVEYNLDSWLEIELAATLRPAGLDDALEYLGERRGLWRILKRMLQPDPMQRLSSKEALEQFDEVMGLKDGKIEWTDRK
jgi:serine/threonine protein kinase